MGDNPEPAAPPVVEGEASKAEGEETQGSGKKPEAKASRTLSVDSDDSLTNVKKDIEEVLIEEPLPEFRVGEWKNMRRIIAEDPEWSLATVPVLKELVVKHIAENFENNSLILPNLPLKYQKRVLGRISTDIPLKITSLLIEDEAYWERCCRSRWEVCDVTAYGSCWKRMYMEKNLQQIIELFVPNTTPSDELEETLQLSAGCVKKLDIGQLLPPVRVANEGPDFDEVSDVGDVEDEIPCDHFNFGPVLSALPLLEELHLCYGVRDCGMNFEWNLFQFTARDCTQLAQAVAACTTLKVFRLHRSKVDDDKVRVLMSHMLNHPGLRVLDLSHNIISDRGARAIGKFLISSQLTSLNLCDNQIRVVGGQAIGHALTKNTTLVTLNMRLNRLGDEGGQAILRALIKNRSVADVNLGSNDLAEPSAHALSQVLVQNDVLKYANLSCNRLGPDSGKQIQDGIEENKTILHLDLRLTECGQESEYQISQVLLRNQEADRLQRIKASEEAASQCKRKVFEPQATHRYRLPSTAVIA